MPDLADLKAHLNYKSPFTAHPDDVELQGMLDAAKAHVAKLIGPFPAVTRTEVVRPHGYLRRVPVAAVTSAAYYSITYTAVVEDPLRGLISGVPAGATVVYEQGRNAETATQRQAVLITAAHLWETQRGTAPTALQDPDGQPQFAPGLSQLVPPRAWQLLVEDMPRGRPVVA